MNRLFKFVMGTLLLSGLCALSGCELEVDEGPVEDATEEVVEE